MTARLLIQLSVISVSLTASLSYAHPNHMSFEDVKHEPVTVTSTVSSGDKISRHDTEQKTGHSDDPIPCTDQKHKTTPCKEK